MESRAAKHTIGCVGTCVLLLACFVLVPGCGYTVRSGMVRDIRTINIATFRNTTFEHGLEITCSKALRREFILDGTLSLVDISKADAQLTGEIVEYIREPYTFGLDETDVEQYRIAVQANVCLKDTATGETIWEEELMEGDDTYYLSGDLAKREEQALTRALYELAKRVVSRTVRGW